MLALFEAHGWRRSRIFLFGFAQGGTAALDLACHGGDLARDGGGSSGNGGGPLGGVISWCGLPLPEAEATLAAGGGAAHSLYGTPVLITSGECDPQAPPALTRHLFERTRAALGLRVRDAQDDAIAGDTRPMCDAGPAAELHVLRGKAWAMVGSAEEAMLLHRFLGRHLELAAGLEDDPELIRVGG